MQAGRTLVWSVIILVLNKYARSYREEDLLEAAKSEAAVEGQDPWPWDDEDDEDEDDDSTREGFHAVQSMELLNEDRTGEIKMKTKKPKCKIIGTSIICSGRVGKEKKKRLQKQLEYGRGPSGRPGPPGMIGMPGPKGPKGERGFPGRPGSRGEEGPRGPSGPSGVKGEQGVVGERGDPGRLGPQGLPGVPGNCKIVPLSDLGGLTCSGGSRGPQGLKGSIGLEGDIGAKGEKGDRGDIGEPGARGSPGPPGTIGPHGSLQLNGPCRKLFSDWAIPNRSPLSLLKTNCFKKEFLQSIEVKSKGPRIRYEYKCCPFLAEDLDRLILPMPP